MQEDQVTSASLSQSATQRASLEQTRPSLAWLSHSVTLPILPLLASSILQHTLVTCPFDVACGHHID